MIEAKDIKKMVAHIVRRNNGITDTAIMHPSREWFIGLSLATCIVALGSWFCWYLYSVQTLKMQSEVIVSESAVPYQAATVKSALELFDTKQEKFMKIIGSESSVVATEIEEDASSTPGMLPNETIPKKFEVSSSPSIEFDGSENQSLELAP